MPCLAQSKLKNHRHSPLSFFLFVQRLHEYATMQEIADAFQTGLAQSWKLKLFVSNICCERYANLEAHQAKVEYLEDNFPAYSGKKAECERECGWGSVKLGRLPEFLYTDASRLREQESGLATQGQDEGAAKYKE